MKIFQHQLWGFQILLPEGWSHKNFKSIDGFAADSRAFESNYEGDTLAQLLINGEWNSLNKPVFDLWQTHLGKSSLMLGAKNIASAEWTMAGAKGFEVEVVLAKKNPRRLWAGILENGMLVLTFLVLHWKENREEMEPLISKIISSLRYLKKLDRVYLTEDDLPLPEPFSPTDPLEIMPDIQDPENWQAYQTEFSTGALQAFYLRELLPLGWNITRYVPYPNFGELPFAQVLMNKAGKVYSLGILPQGEGGETGSIILKRIP